jgi:hypothetical protein
MWMLRGYRMYFSHMPCLRYLKPIENERRVVSVSLDPRGAAETCSHHGTYRVIFSPTLNLLRRELAPGIEKMPSPSSGR